MEVNVGYICFEFHACKIIEEESFMSKKYLYLFSEGNATMRELLGG